jgi:zinc/manganese transport system substrate-binding protein
MNKLWIALALFLLGGMAPRAEAKVRVISTLQDFASIAQAVGGDRIEVDSLAKGYQDPHFVDAKPSLILKLSKADLLLVAVWSWRSATCLPCSIRAGTPRSTPGIPATSISPRAARCWDVPRGR